MDFLPPVEKYSLRFLYAARENVANALKERLPLHTHKALVIKLTELDKEIKRRTTNGRI